MCVFLESGHLTCNDDDVMIQCSDHEVLTLVWFLFDYWVCLYLGVCTVTFHICAYLFPLAPRCFDSEMEEILLLFKASDELL